MTFPARQKRRDNKENETLTLQTEKERNGGKPCPATPERTDNRTASRSSKASTTLETENKEKERKTRAARYSNALRVKRKASRRNSEEKNVKNKTYQISKEKGKNQKVRKVVLYLGGAKATRIAGIGPCQKETRKKIEVRQRDDLGNRQKEQ